MTENRPPFPVSASQVKKYKSCPKAYEFGYLTGLEETKGDKGYLALGNTVHDSIEHVMERTPHLRDRDDLEFRFKQKAEELLDGEYDVPDDMEDDVWTCLEKAAKYISSRSDAEITGIEDTIEFEIDEEALPYPQKFVAKMDVTTNTEIWDWKTGKVREEDEVIQGAVYMAAYASVIGRPPENIVFIYLKEGKVRSLDASDENWNVMIEWAQALLNAWKEQEFPAQPGDFCYFCSYEMFCEASPVSAAGVDWSDY